MKSYSVALLLSVITATGAFGQHEHEKLEQYFSELTLKVFERDLNITVDQLKNQNNLDLIDEKYQLFFSAMKTRIQNDENISQEDFNEAYKKLVDQVRKQLNKSKPPQNNTPKALNGPCENMDFEQGNFTGWELTRGDVDGSAPYSYVGEFSVGPGAYHTVYNSGTDPVTGIPRVNPLSGTYSVRIGNGTGVGARAARVRQTFLVDPTNYMFTYSYAVVFQSPSGHALNELPYFTVRVFDSSGNSIPCGEYSVIASDATAADYENTTWGGSTVLFKNWQSVFTNLSTYIGQNVTVEFTAGDCSLGGHFGYAYVDASCSVDQITATNNLICTGDSSVLTAPAGAASYSWSNGGTSRSTTVYSGGTYSCTLTPFQGGACTVTLDITIDQNPSPTANYLNSPPVGCVSDSVFFMNMSSIVAPGVISSYRWDFGDGVISPLSSGVMTGVANTTGTYTNPVHTFMSAGVFQVELYIESSDGCADSITKIVTINALPFVNAGPDQLLCDGSSVTLSGSGAVSYTWDNGVTNGVPFTQNPSTITYTVTGTDGNGCTNTDQADVTVFTLPTISAGSDQDACDSSQVVLTGTGGAIYTWSNGVTNGEPFLQEIGSVTYFVNGIDENGCENTDEVIVTVHSIPDVQAGDDLIICEGSAVVLNGSGALTYVWDNGVVNGESFIPPVGSNTYSVVGTDIYGCQNTDSLEILVNALPNVDAGVDQELCENSEITLIASGATFYTWNNGVVNGVSFTPNVGTTIYTVTGIDLNGCVNSDQVSVVVNALPNVFAGSDQLICDSSLITLFGAGAADYSWDHGVIDNVPFNQSLGIITYTVIGTDINGCQNTDQVDVSVNSIPTVEAGDDQIICEGTEIVLTGTGTATYSWTNGVVNGVPFVPSVGAYTYVVTGTDVNGCQDVDSVEVVINALPLINAGPDLVICEGDSVVLAATGGIALYVWDNGIIDGISFIPSTGLVVYHVTGADINGCRNSDSVVVTVLESPDVVAGSDIVVCEGTRVTLFATGTSNLIWSPIIVNGETYSPEVGRVTYFVRDSLANGCVDIDSLVVTVYPNPVLVVYDTLICRGSEVVLTAEGADTYQWTGGIENGIPFIPEQSATYTVIGTSIHGCTSSATSTVTIGEYPNTDFTWLNKDLSTSDLVSGFDNLTTGAVQYQWSFGDGTQYNYEFEPIHTFSVDEGGIYVVQLIATSKDGCSSLVSKLVNIRQDYAIFAPNAFTPNNDNLNDRFNPILFGFEEDSYTFLIFNRWGEIIFESHDMDKGWDGTYGIRKDDAVLDGVYNWKVIARVKNTADNKVFVGHVSILK